MIKPKAISETEIGHTEILTKCLGCGLHFVLLTWEPDKHNEKSMICPECGRRNGCFMVTKRNRPELIFQRM